MDRKTDTTYRHMARDEMTMINEDRWDEEIWGVEKPDHASGSEIPQLYFYFAEKVSEVK